MKKIIQTTEAPQAIGTYSQAVKVGTQVYLSGQIALNPQTMQMVNDSIEAEIQQMFENFSAVAKAAGGSLADMVKVTIYVTDMDYFPQVNAAMSQYFQAPYPARAVIGVAALPKQARVEIDGVMQLPNA
jgi:reactive intermediate/imine deaminase